MTQPTDRLGQPLAVGDWVLAPSHCQWGEFSGERLPILGFVETSQGIEFISRAKCGRETALAYCHRATKINPNTETTIWDKCEWQPNLQEIER